MAERPPDDQPGYEWYAAVDEDWRLLPDDTSKHCRYWQGHRDHPVLADAEFQRHRWMAGGRTPVWWAYCADHLYGRWIEDGLVWSWRRRAIA
jgi:hypothetical protein